MRPNSKNTRVWGQGGKEDKVQRLTDHYMDTQAIHSFIGHSAISLNEAIDSFLVFPIRAAIE
jgi:hypothetical protein